MPIDAQTREPSVRGLMRPAAFALLGSLRSPQRHPAPPRMRPRVGQPPDTEKAPQGDMTYHGPFTQRKGQSQSRKTVRACVSRHHARSARPALMGLGASKEGSQSPAGDWGRISSCRIARRADAWPRPSAIGPTIRGLSRTSKFQNFPSPVTGDQPAPQTEATAKSSLGYNYAPARRAAALYPMDATYHIHLVIPHNAARLSRASTHRH